MTIEAHLAELVRTVVREVVREELAQAKATLDAGAGGNGLPEYLTPQAAAAHVVDVTPDTIREWVKARKLRGYHPGNGRRVLVRLAELRAFIEKQVKGPSDRDLDEEADAIGRRVKVAT